MCNTSQSCHELDFNHTHACTCDEWNQVRNTNKTEKKVRATRCSVFIPVAYKGIAIACKRNSLKQIYECARILQSGCHTGFAKSLQPSLFAPLVISPLVILPFVISPLSVLVFTPLRVLMFVLPPILWRWWRGRRLREIGVPILTPPFLFCSQRFIEWSLPHSLVLRNNGILSSFFLSKTCENVRSGSEICSCFHWSTLTILIVAHQRDGALVPVPLMPGCGARDVDRREVAQLSAIFFRRSMGPLRISVLFILLHLITMVPWSCFHGPLLASIAFQWSCCHRVSPCFLPLERFTRAKK